MTFGEGLPMKRMLSIVTILGLMVQMSGCSVKRVRRVNAPDLSNPALEKIVGITTKKGEDVSFQPPGAVVTDNKILGKVNNNSYEISLDQVERFWIERKEMSTARTVGLVAGLVVGTIVVVGLVVVATKESCPFVYSWDGQQYIFDGEPYGAAVTKGLERDDYSELEHLVPDNGIYRLKISNEVPETQFTNLMELFVADHDSDRVALDSAGNLYSLSSIQAPIGAVDETGSNLLPWLKATDKRIWEPQPEVNPSANVRQDIRITFPKPAAATEARLVVNAATSLWGSYMIKELLELRGSGLDAWYHSIDTNTLERSILQAWNEREELFMLKIDVEENGEWMQRGLMLGGGPFVLEDRVINLDVSRASGNQLNIRIRPPKGFWALNSFGVDYAPNKPIDLQTLHPIECRDSSGRDRLSQIAAVDDLYYDMPNVGDQGTISFREPTRKPGMKRALFLHTRGYYQIHLGGTGKPDNEALTSIMTVPDSAARYAGLRYAARHAEQAALRKDASR
jgi:hypothetical protein